MSPSSQAREALDRAQRAGESAVRHPLVKDLARVGFCAKGLVYALIGLLGIQSALGVHTASKDVGGAMTALWQTPLGELLVPLLGAGLASYAVWCFVQTLFDPDLHDAKWKSVGHRIVHFFSGLAAVTMSLRAFMLVAKQHSRSNDATVRTWSARLMELPAGRYLVAAVGIGFVVAAIVGVVNAVNGKFCEKLDLSGLSRPARTWAIDVSKVGLIARAFFFGAVGVFFVLAAYHYNPAEAAGLNGAFRVFARQTFGLILVIALGVGLWAFACHMIVMALYEKHVVRKKPRVI